MDIQKVTSDYRISQWMHVIQERQCSGQSVKDFCQEKEISSMSPWLSLMKTQENTAEKLLEIIEEKDRKIAELELQVEWFMAQIRLAKHKQFGVSSEKTGIPQLSIFNEVESNADITMPEPKLAEVKAHYRKRNCEGTSENVPILKADMPEPVVKGGFATPETIAHIAVQKFMMASPLYRQEQEWKQNGILLSRQTMSNWLLKASEDWLEPIYEKMKHRLSKHEVLHADETTLQVLKEPGKAAQSKSYMWLYRTSGEAKHQIVIYDYQADRRHIHPVNFLKSFKGYLHADYADKLNMPMF